MKLVSTVGGASGPLYGTLLPSTRDGHRRPARPIGLDDLVTALDAGFAGVQRIGKALGDKTMLDALSPARDALREAAATGVPLQDALGRLVRQPSRGCYATIPLVARKGRASYLGERSAGHQDPGATSSYFLLKSAADTFAGRSQVTRPRAGA